MAVTQPLSVWFNGGDYVIAASAQHATTLLAEHTGDPSTAPWEETQAHSLITLWMFEGEVAMKDFPGARLVTRPAMAWLELGVGYVASTED